MGTLDFYGAIHIKRRQTSKGKIANATAQCKWALTYNTTVHIMGHSQGVTEHVADQ